MENTYKDLEEKFPEFFRNGIKPKDFISAEFGKNEKGQTVIGFSIKEGLPENIKDYLLKNSPQT